MAAQMHHMKPIAPDGCNIFLKSLVFHCREYQKTKQPQVHQYKFQELQLGDLMFFSTRKDKSITHVGIYMGNDYWISNLNEESNVKIL